MAKVKNRKFWESARYNSKIFMQYYMRLVELSVAMFEWKNLPDTVDPRFLELALFGDGKAIFFKDEDLGMLALRTNLTGNFNLYGIPTNRVAYADNGYINSDLNESNSVVIFNNFLRSSSVLDVEIFAQRLANLDKTIDVNTNAQKTPVLIKCGENDRLTMKNLYMKYEGNMPFIFANKNFAQNDVTVLKTDAPYLADKLFQLKTQVWNEALTYLGISNVNFEKKERMLQDEVTRNQGGTIASRYSRLEARRQACDKINKMFGTDIWVDYREDFQEISPDNDTIDGEPNTDGEGGVVKHE